MLAPCQHTGNAATKAAAPFVSISVLLLSSAAAASSSSYKLGPAGDCILLSGTLPPSHSQYAPHQLYCRLSLELYASTPGFEQSPCAVSAPFLRTSKFLISVVEPCRSVPVNNSKATSHTGRASAKVSTSDSPQTRRNTAVSVVHRYNVSLSFDREMGCRPAYLGTNRLPACDCD